MWRDIRGLEGRYQISDAGEVRSVGFRCRRGLWHEPQLMKQRLWDMGYYGVVLSGEKKKIGKYVHRLMAEAFIPNPENKPFINHKDGKKANNALSNLEWCTHQENVAHAHRIGLIPPSEIGPGEDSPAAKLNDEKVLEIRRRLAAGELHRTLAAEYGVAKGTIGFIARRETWAHI
jgi:hypothetical protein